MKQPVIFDASVIAAWLLPDEASSYADRLVALAPKFSVHAPEHWRLEIMNILRMAEKRDRITQSSCERLYEQFSIVFHQVEDSVCDFSAALSAARRWNLTIYDAAYLTLALRVKCPLLTFDKALDRAATDSGLPPTSAFLTR